MIDWGSRPTIKTEFHVDLSDAFPGEEYWLSAFGEKHALQAHTEETRAAARAAWPKLAQVPDERLTHCTVQPVVIPADRVVRLHVKNTLKTFAVPQGATGVGNVTIPCLPSPPELQARADAATQHMEYIDYVSTARALIYHHPDLITTDPQTAKTICGYMENLFFTPMFQQLGQTMRDMGPPTPTPPPQGSGWAQLVAFTPPKGQYFDGTTTYYRQVARTEIVAEAGAVMTQMLIATRNDMTLQGKKWSVRPGTAVQSNNSSAPPGKRGPWRRRLAAGTAEHQRGQRLDRADASPRCGQRPDPADP
jgi:hypothetical protein